MMLCEALRIKKSINTQIKGSSKPYWQQTGLKRANLHHCDEMVHSSDIHLCRKLTPRDGYSDSASTVLSLPRANFEGLGINVRS